MDTISISPVDLSIAAMLVILLAAFAVRTDVGMSRSMLIAALRTTVQLLLVGLVLKAVFADVSFWWILVIAAFMLLVAGREVMVRQGRRFVGWWGYGLGTVTMFVSSFFVTLLTLLVIVGPQPWYEPRYSIPLLGMILGNTMTGVALSLDSLTRLTSHRKGEIEARLLLGFSSEEAMSAIRRDSIHTGLIPMINAMTAAGIVSLPGMMTGQILAGNPPMEAVKYQILVMFLISAGTGFGTLSAVWLGSRRLFDGRQRLRLDRLRRP